MRLLRVIRNTNPESGGPIERLLSSSEALLRDGHEVEVVSLESEKDVAKRQFPFRVTALGRGVGKYGYNPRLAPWVRQNAGRFDAVVMHGLWNYSSFGAWLGLRRTSTPYYIFTHGMMDPWFRHAYPLKHFAKQVYWWFAEGRVLRDAQKVLFTTEEEMVRARNVFSGYSYNERVVRYGTVDPAGDEGAEKAAFFRAFPGLENKQFLIFLSRIHPKKGCDLLIRAFAELSKQLPENVDLVIAGPDQVHWVQELRDLALRLNVAHRVHWPGMLQGELKWGAFRAAEAMILPSHQENFGIVVAEAMACRTPVLISDKVNIWREVESSGGGLVEPDNVDGTRNLMQRFLELTAEERSKMKRAARQGFLDYFDGEASARDLAQVIGFDSGAIPPFAAPRKYRVLHVIRTTDAESGGPVEALVRFSEVLVRDNHEVEVVSLENASEIAQRSFPIRVTALGRGIGRYGCNPRLTSWIRTNARRFDVVVMHGLWNFSSFGAWLGLRNQSTPYYIFPHGMMDPWFRRKYPLKHIAKIVYWWLAEGRVLRDAKKVFFTCEDEKLLARNMFLGHTYTESVVGLGTADPTGNPNVEIKTFFTTCPALNNRSFLLFLGRIHAKKGCDLLIRAFAACLSEVPPDLDLVFAGPDRTGLRTALQRLAQRLGVGSRVHWPGMLKGANKWGAIRASEALILPSHQENFGFVVAEAMACSTPVLISDKVNIWREVVESRAGLVEPDTFEGTRNLIRRFCALSFEQRTAMKRAARQGFLRHFVIEEATRGFERAIGLPTSSIHVDHLQQL